MHECEWREIAEGLASALRTRMSHLYVWSQSQLIDDVLKLYDDHILKQDVDDVFFCHPTSDSICEVAPGHENDECQGCGRPASSEHHHMCLRPSR